MTKKKGKKKVAHISVTSDGVRSGEEPALAVSKGVVKTSTTTKDLIESLVVQYQRLKSDYVIREVQVQAALDGMLTKAQVQEMLDRQLGFTMIQIVESENRIRQQADAINARLAALESPSWFGRVVIRIRKILGVEK